MKILPVRPVLKSVVKVVSHGRVNSSLLQHAVLLLILRHEVKAKENHGQAHGSVTSEMDTEGNEVAGRVVGQENLRA